MNAEQAAHCLIRRCLLAQDGKNEAAGPKRTAYGSQAYSSQISRPVALDFFLRDAEFRQDMFVRDGVMAF